MAVGRPTPTADPSLAALLAGVTEDNLHAEVAFGAACGREAW